MVKAWSIWHPTVAWTSRMPRLVDVQESVLGEGGHHLARRSWKRDLKALLSAPLPSKDPFPDPPSTYLPTSSHGQTLDPSFPHTPDLLSLIPCHCKVSIPPLEMAAPSVAAAASSSPPSPSSPSAPGDSVELQTLGGNSRQSSDKDSSKSEPPVAIDRQTTVIEDPGVKEEDTVNRVLTYAPGGKRTLRAVDCPSKTGFGWSNGAKWRTLWVLFLVQISINFNPSVYGSAAPGIAWEFGVSPYVASLGLMAFLIPYAFGCELWAPWSEVYGRKWNLFLSLLLVNCWAVGASFSRNFTQMAVFRALGGLCSAGGSVTLGVVADLYGPNDLQGPVNFVVFASNAGSVVGPLLGGVLATYLGWRWCFYMQVIFGIVVMLAQLCLVPETLPGKLVTKEARRRRAVDPNCNVYSEDELNPPKLTLQECLSTWRRPFCMFLLEPIVLFLSLLSGFSDALIFLFMEGFGHVYGQWGFNLMQVGLAFIPIGLSYAIGYFMFCFFIARNRREIKRTGELRPEQRLWGLLWTAPLLSIGLISFAWLSLGPSYGIHWCFPMIASMLVGIANYSIYIATIDYMVAAYGVYASSATGGNGFARDLLAGLSNIYAVHLFTKMPGKYPIPTAISLLAGLAFVFAIPVFLFYYFGPAIRAWSHYAKKIQAQREEDREIKDRHVRNSRPPTRAPSLEEQGEQADAADAPVAQPAPIILPGPSMFGPNAADAV
ncbi:MFS general substrate transporter [Aulographum hederae CBS 113979]|uniref:MFS general substrate transporter n=1 Tax=Aulographum hederae CBS 113979 TaxID=1176131 RepID=A0A6G1GK09_9PEZI|nr:MFS general substrate transporter [Aulographum hederae CBS 113979]